VNTPYPAVPPPSSEPEPERLQTLDIVQLTTVEAFAVLIHVAGHRDPAVAAAVADAVAGVLARTRLEVPS
jgi:hypothetical protein